MPLSAYREVTVLSKMDDQETILAMFSRSFEEDPKTLYSLLNIYKELPICNNASIVELKGRRIEFETTPLQLAAIDFSGETIIQAPFFNMSVLAKIAYLDARHKLIALGDFRYAEVLIDKRATVRVKLKIPLNVKLNVDGGQISAVMRDISLGGCCLSTLVGDGLVAAEKTSMHIKIMNEGKVVEIDVPTRVVRVGEGPPHDCAIMFQHTPESERVLSLFIYQRQLEIIRELKEKC